MQDIAAALEEEERAEDTADDKKFTEFHMIGEVSMLVYYSVQLYSGTSAMSSCAAAISVLNFVMYST
jgi:hypothetical protein